MPGALDDLRVIDFTHALNGPFCTMLLGHLGAEIIKVEPPGGDAFRRQWMPNTDREGYEFLWLTMNKKSVVLNLRTKRGKELARELIAKSDVLVENFQQGTMEKFGLDYDSIKDLNPRLIYACSRGFGEWGPYSPYGSNAGVNNGMAGWTHTGWGYTGTPGTKTMGIGDEAAGVSMAVGILAALHEREHSGQGQKIVVSMQEAVMGFMISSFHEHFTGNMIGTQPFPVADGYFTLRTAEVSDEGWQTLAKLMGHDDLVDDERFATAAARGQNHKQIDHMVREWASQRTRQEVWEGTRDLGYFGSPILSIAEMLEDPHVVARKAFVERDHPEAGPTTFLAPWIHLSRTPTSIRWDSPEVGAHTDEVLTSVLGFSAGQISDLHSEGAVQ